MYYCIGSTGLVGFIGNSFSLPNITLNNVPTPTIDKTNPSTPPSIGIALIKATTALTTRVYNSTFFMFASLSFSNLATITTTPVAVDNIIATIYAQIKVNPIGVVKLINVTISATINPSAVIANPMNPFSIIVLESYFLIFSILFAFINTNATTTASTIALITFLTKFSNILNTLTVFTVSTSSLTSITFKEFSSTFASLDIVAGSSNSPVSSLISAKSSTVNFPVPTETLSAFAFNNIEAPARYASLLTSELFESLTSCPAP